jgi:hypothetical protein
MINGTDELCLAIPLSCVRQQVDFSVQAFALNQAWVVSFSFPSFTMISGFLLMSSV